MDVTVEVTVMAKNKRQISNKALAVPKDRKVWKIVSISFIAVFCVFLFFGAMKVYRFKSSFSPATSEQIKAAENIVSADLKNNGDDITNYAVHVNNRVRHAGKRGTANVVQVSLSKNAITQLYLINLDKSAVVMHSKTEFYGEMGNFEEHPESRHDWDLFKRFRSSKE